MGEKVELFDEEQGGRGVVEAAGQLLHGGLAGGVVGDGADAGELLRQRRLAEEGTRAAAGEAFHGAGRIIVGRVVPACGKGVPGPAVGGELAQVIGQRDDAQAGADADLAEIVRDSLIDERVGGEGVDLDVDVEIEALGVAGFGEQAAGAGGIVRIGPDGRIMASGHARGGLAGGHAEAAQQHLGDGLPVHGHVEGAADAHVLQRAGGGALVDEGDRHHRHGG